MSGGGFCRATWSSSITTEPPRAFVFVNLETWLTYHRERREIERRFPAFTDAPDGMDLSEHWENVARLRVEARLELRYAMRQMPRLGLGGSYAVPV